MQISMQFYEGEQSTSMGMCLGIEEAWLRKPMQKLVKKFFRAYAVTHTKKDAGLYGVIDPKTGADLSDSLVGDVTFEDDRASLFVVKVRQRSLEKTTSKKNLTPNTFDNDYDALCFQLFEQQHRNLPLCQYMHARRRLMDAMQRRRDAPPPPPPPPQEKKPPKPTMEEEDDEIPAEFRPRSKAVKERCEAKDWDAINYKKALCPYIVAGHKKCPRGSECTYAHSYAELRVETAERILSTADRPLDPPELWQLGVFAPKDRQSPFLWQRMTR